MNKKRNIEKEEYKSNHPIFVIDRAENAIPNLDKNNKEECNLCGEKIEKSNSIVVLGTSRFYENTKNAVYYHRLCLLYVLYKKFGEIELDEETIEKITALAL